MASGRAGERWTRAAIAAAGAALGLASLLRRPDVHYFGGFLVGDQGFSLHVTDRLLNGERLYQEVAYPYGPIPAYLHAAVAAAFGNSARTYNAAFLVLSALNLALLYTLLRRYASRPVAVAVAIVGATPSLLIPGSLLGAFTSSLYVPLERTLLLLLALFWRPPGSRTRRQAVLLGLVLGVWQGVRFGPALFAGAAVAAVDALAVARSAPRVGLARWARSLAPTLAAFLLCQAAWAAGALLLLSPRVAGDVLWPSYMVGSYQGWVTSELRWPRWQGWGLFLGQCLTPLVGAAAAAGGAAYLLFRGRIRAHEAGALALFVPAAFFALGAAGLFRHVHHFHQYMWALVVPTAWLAQRAGARARAGLFALLLPCFLLNARVVFLNRPDPSVQPVTTPSGERLWITPGFAAAVAAVQREHATAGEGGRGLLFVPLGAGMHHFYRFPGHARQTWFLPGFVRPYDEADLLAALERTQAMVVLTAGGEEAVGDDPCTWTRPVPAFRAPFCAALDARLGTPVKVAPGVWMAAVKPPAGDAPGAGDVGL